MRLRITDLSRGGAGLGRLEDGRVVFVPKTAPGDEVEVAIVGGKKRYLHGRVQRLIAPSPQRIEPKCQYFDRCGGCEWQHLAYTTQWEVKKEGAKYAFERLAQFNSKEKGVDWREFPADEPFHYRNRIQLHGDAGQLGYFERDTRALIAIDRCEIASESLNASLPSIRTEAEKKMKGPFEVELREASTSDGQSEVQSAWFYGKRYSEFSQVNDLQNHHLREWVFEQVPEGSVVLDLYGGLGNLSLGLLSKVKSVVCVDVNAPQDRSTDSIRFVRSSVRQWCWKATHETVPELDALLRGGSRVLILDPPRAGLGSDFAYIRDVYRKLQITKILLVGCHTDTWARDMVRLMKDDWKVQGLALFDFFPQTHHVESAGALVQL